MAVAARRKRVTSARADRAIAAVVVVIECDDFKDYQLVISQLLSTLDSACDKLREMREIAK